MGDDNGRHERRGILIHPYNFTATPFTTVFNTTIFQYHYFHRHIFPTVTFITASLSTTNNNNNNTTQVAAVTLFIISILSQRGEAVRWPRNGGLEEGSRGPAEMPWSLTPWPAAPPAEALSASRGD